MKYLLEFDIFNTINEAKAYPFSVQKDHNTFEYNYNASDGQPYHARIVPTDNSQTEWEFVFKQNDENSSYLHRHPRPDFKDILYTNAMIINDFIDNRLDNKKDNKIMLAPVTSTKARLFNMFIIPFINSNVEDVDNVRYINIPKK